MDDVTALLERIARLEALVAAQQEIIAAQAARIAEVVAELRRRGKKFTPKANAEKRPPANSPIISSKKFPNRKSKFIAFVDTCAAVKNAARWRPVATISLCRAVISDRGRNC